MTLSQKQRKCSQLIGQLIGWAYENGYEIVLGHAWRTKEEQLAYYNSGASKVKVGKHPKCLAIDINLFKDGKYLTETPDYKPLGDYWKSLDSECVWGGDWGWDGGHFQYTK